MLLKVAVEKDNATGAITWHNLYANSIRLRLRKDYNLLDIPDKELARKNLGVTDAIAAAKLEAITTSENYTDKEVRWLDDRLSLQVQFNLDNIKQMRKEFGFWLLKDQDAINKWNNVTYESIDLSTEAGARAQGFTENESIHVQNFAKVLNARNPNSEGAIASNNILERFWFDANKKSSSYKDDTNFVDYVYYALSNAKTYIDDENTAQDTEWERKYAELKEWITNEINVLTNWMVARFADWQFAIGYVLKQEHSAVNQILENLTTTYNKNFSDTKVAIDSMKTDLHNLYKSTMANDKTNENSSKAIVNLLKTIIPNLYTTIYNQEKAIVKNIALWVYEEKMTGLMVADYQNEKRIAALNDAVIQLMQGTEATLQFLKLNTQVVTENNHGFSNGKTANVAYQKIIYETTGKKLWIA